MQTHSRISIIDDDAISVFGLKRAMSGINFTPDISVFENGLDALENFKKLLAEDAVLPTILFVDLNMPVMDGWDFIKELSKLIPSQNDMPKIYVMTSSIDTRDVEKAKNLCLEANYLIKPVYKEVLAKILI